MRQTTTISADRLREQQLEALMGLPSLKKTAVGRPTTTTPAVGRPTTTTPAVGRPTTTTSPQRTAKRLGTTMPARLAPGKHTGITKRTIPFGTRTPVSLQLDRLAKIHDNYKRPVRFSKRDHVDNEMLAHGAYKYAETNGLIALLNAVNTIGPLNNIEIPDIPEQAINKYGKRELRQKYFKVLTVAKNYLEDAILFFYNAIDGRYYTCDAFYDRRSDWGHNNAIRLLKEEIVNIHRYINYIVEILHDMQNETVKQPEIATYVFVNPVLAFGEKKTVVFPIKCCPAEFCEEMKRKSTAVG